MKEFQIYNLIIENSKCPAEKKLFDSCKEGDTVALHIAPFSEHLLKIELKNELLRPF